MDFQFVLGNVIDGFERVKIRYALMGGFAMGALGAPRATKDLDFLVCRDDLEKLHLLLTSLKYKRIFYSENVSQYEGESIIWGCLDFIHAFRQLGLEMLDRAIEKPIMAGRRMVRILRPEDVIGLKVQAMANTPKRKTRETADIEELIEAHPKDLDWDRVEYFYGLFGLEKELKELKEHVGRV